jgi:uncharacterized membrane protein YfcA
MGEVRATFPFWQACETAESGLPRPAGREKVLIMVSQTLLYAGIGLLAGLSAGWFGIGGGTIVVPALILLCGVPYHVAVGTSLALIIPISLAGTATSWKLNTVDWRIVFACAVTGMIGAVAGSYLIQKVPEMIARRAFAVFLLYAAWRLWTK